MDGWPPQCRTGRAVVLYYALCFKKAPQQDSACTEITSNDWSGVLLQVAKFLLYSLGPLMNETLEITGLRRVCSLFVAAKLGLCLFSWILHIPCKGSRTNSLPELYWPSQGGTVPFVTSPWAGTAQELQSKQFTVCLC